MLPQMSKFFNGQKLSCLGRITWSFIIASACKFFYQRVIGLSICLTVGDEHYESLGIFKAFLNRVDLTKCALALDPCQLLLFCVFFVCVCLLLYCVMLSVKFDLIWFYNVEWISYWFRTLLDYLLSNTTQKKLTYYIVCLYFTNAAHLVTASTSNLFDWFCFFECLMCFFVIDIFLLLLLLLK